MLVEGAPRWGRLDGGSVVLDSGELIDEASATYLAPVEPTKIIATHLTYRSRVEEYAARTPPEPSYFMKPPTTLNGHRGQLRRPRGARFLNYEGEVAVVIGRRMHGVAEADALDYVGGYACANDVGLHDFRHADRGSMLRVKGQDGFCPIGPELVPASQFDPTGFEIRTLLNGEVVQQGSADDLIWPIAYLLADLCRLITLEPGDVVLSGHARELAADAARRRGRGRGERARPAVATAWSTGTSTCPGRATSCRSRPTPCTSPWPCPRTRRSGRCRKESRDHDRDPPHRPRGAPRRRPGTGRASLGDPVRADRGGAGRPPRLPALRL